jgi:bifunctional UDP-N-acetylglucosamine pyrophosphorylase/glucosamine-1-phosphate N-acetyltransferase
VALTAFPDDDLDSDDLIVLPGDTPLLQPSTLLSLIRHHRRTDAAATVLTARVPDPTGYGRVLRDKDGRVQAIVEEADASDDERQIDEVSTSVFCFRRSLLAPALRRLSPENAQGEYYLPDVIGVLHDAGYPVHPVLADDWADTAGVNDRVQLAAAEAVLRDRINRRWMGEGVTMVDPAHTYVDAGVRLASDVTLFPGTMLSGRTVVGSGARIGPDARLVDCVVGPGAVVEHTVGSDAEIGRDARVGPFAFLRPGSHVAEGATTGPFYTGRAGDEDGL